MSQGRSYSEQSYTGKVNRHYGTYGLIENDDNVAVFLFSENVWLFIGHCRKGKAYYYGIEPYPCEESEQYNPSIAAGDGVYWIIDEAEKQFKLKYTHK